jgi:hypothetical protein
MKPPPPPNPPDMMDTEEKRRLRMAAHRIQRIIPGPIGLHLSEQLMFWEECAYRFDTTTKAAKLIEAIETFEVVYAGPQREGDTQTILHDEIDHIIAQWLDTMLALTGVPPH